MTTSWVEKLFGESAPLKVDQAFQAGTRDTPSFLGIELPADLVQQLKMVSSTPVEWLNDWEIRAAAIAYADGELVEDAQGDGLIDKLSLDLSEQAASAGDIAAYAHNFEPSSITCQLIDAGSKITEAMPEYLANFSFVERYLSEIGSNTLSII